MSELKNKNLNLLVDFQEENDTSINFILDIPLNISVELGRKKLKISEFLKLTLGSVLELDKAIGAPLNVMANGRPVAKGEMVIVNRQFALKLTEIIEPDARIKNLGSQE